MAYEPTLLVQRAWRTPPRCLSEVNATPLSNPPEGAAVFDELGYFLVSCPCGSKEWHVVGHAHPEAGLLCPVTLQCAHCQRLAPIFDIEKHGYDAEFGHGCYSMRAEGPSGRFLCPQCSNNTFEVFPSFSYQIEPIEDMPEEAQSSVEDYFDGFNLDVRCSHCGVLENPVGYECA